jgi:hypothetical protein
MQSVQVGSAIQFTIRNTAGTAVAITVVAGAGGTISGTSTIAQNNQKSFLLVITALGDVNGVGATYTAYSLGTVVF